MSTAAPRKSSALRMLLPELSDISCTFVGHSGAIVSLHGSGARAFVRKQVGDVANNERLMRQAEKQRSLSAHGMPFPRVLGQGLDGEGLAYFDMEYAPGRTVADAAIQAASIDRPAIKKALANLIWLFRMQEGSPVAQSLFRSKIDDISNKSITHRPTAGLMAEIRDAHALLSSCDWENVPQSPSHGDLTLENILLTRQRGVVFIDCDDPWISSWWLDVAKLFQDLTGHWCLRGLYQAALPAQFFNALQKLEQIAGDCRTLAADSDLLSRLPQLVALNLFRCLPYVKREDDARFVCTRIRHVMTSP